MIARPGLRVACVREVQNSLKDSVYQLLVDTIQRLGVGSLFDVVEAEIRGPGGAICVFKGMKDQNAESVKSLEGFDIVWWEEAQTASQRSLDVLRPTIRKPGSELWFTWNPRLRTDPVDRFLRQSNIPSEDIVLVKANFMDNPWFSQELEKERQLDILGDPERYAHIWLGEYEAESDMQFIGGGLVRGAMSRTPHWDLSDPLILGVDVARYGDDKSWLQPRRGRNGHVPALSFAKISTMQLASHVAAWIVENKPDGVFVDEGGVGGGVVDRLHDLGHRVIGVNFGGKADAPLAGVGKAKNKRTEMWAAMRSWLSFGAIPDDPDFESELTGPLFQYDADQAMHLEKKSDMRKRGVKSPDRADALALTFAYPVAAQSVDRERERIHGPVSQDYDPYRRAG